MPPSARARRQLGAGGRSRRNDRSTGRTARRMKIRPDLSRQSREDSPDQRRTGTVSADTGRRLGRAPGTPGRPAGHASAGSAASMAGRLRRIFDLAVLPAAAPKASLRTRREDARCPANCPGGGAGEHGQMLQPETLATMFRPHYQPDPRIPGMGLGFFRGHVGEHQTVGSRRDLDRLPLHPAARPRPGHRCHRVRQQGGSARWPRRARSPTRSCAACSISPTTPCAQVSPSSPRPGATCAAGTPSGRAR